jgi:hypothetical protein
LTPDAEEPHSAGVVADYNHCRYDESINNLTPDVYFGRGQIILVSSCREKESKASIAPTPLGAPTASRATSSTKGASASLSGHRSLSQKL